MELITKQDWTIRKANICWIAQKANAETDTVFIRAMLGPDLAGK